VPSSERRHAVIANARAKRLIGERTSFHIEMPRIEREVRIHKNWQGLLAPGVLYGLGELLAHSSAGFQPEFFAAGLRKNRPRMLGFKRVLRRLLNAASQLAYRKVPPGPAVNKACREALRQKEVTPELVSLSGARESSRPALYGLFAVAEFTLAVCPEIYGDWLRTDADEWTAAAVFNDRVRSMRWEVTVERDLPLLLRSGLPVFQVIALDAALAGVFETSEMRTHFERIAVCLRQGPQCVRSTFALSTIVVDKVRLQNLRAINKVDAPASSRKSGGPLVDLPPSRPKLFLPAAEQRRRREALMMGPANDPTRMRLVDAEALMDSALDLLCEHAPTEGFKATELELLRRCFNGERARLFLRFAQRLGTGDLRNQALKEALNEIGELLLPGSVRDRFTRPLSQVEDFEGHLVVLQGVLALKQSDGEADLVRQIIRLLTPLTKAADPVLKAPYAAHRHPESYASALQHRLLGVWVALGVGNGNADQELNPMPELTKAAVEQARTVLRYCRGDIDNQQWEFNVAQAVLWLMMNGQHEDLRAEWAADASLPPLTRCLVSWLTPHVVALDSGFAVTLLRQAILDATSDHENGEAHVVLELLDLAMAHSHDLGDPIILESVVDAWQGALFRWHPIWRAAFIPAATTLLSALRGDVAAQQLVLSSSDFGKSRCAERLTALISTAALKAQ